MAIDDLESLVKVASNVSPSKIKAQQRNFNFNYFPRYRVIQEFMNKLAQKSNNTSKVMSIGSTSEGRKIYAMRIEGSANNPVSRKFNSSIKLF